MQSRLCIRSLRVLGGIGCNTVLSATHTIGVPHHVFRIIYMQWGEIGSRKYAFAVPTSMLRQYVPSNPDRVSRFYDVVSWREPCANMLVQRGSTQHPDHNLPCGHVHLQLGHVHQACMWLALLVAHPTLRLGITYSAFPYGPGPRRECRNGKH